MILPQPLHSGVLIRRYQRFLAEVRLSDGAVVTAHCPNSGSMKGCAIPGSPVLLSESDSPRRKLRYTWETVQVNGIWIGIHTGRTNRLAREGIEQGMITELQGYGNIRQEVPYAENSRIDLLLEFTEDLCYVEVKNVTLVEDRLALFPDAVTTRGQKHLRHLMQMVGEGHRAVTLFIVQREDAEALSPADAIDSEYGRLLREAVNAGVEVLAYQAKVAPPEIRVCRKLPVRL